MSDGAYDVAVIGAGVVGAAIARELSRHALRVALVEAKDDVGAGTSKANTAILHTGFDAKPGTLEARLVTRGYQLLKEYARDVGVAVEETGALLVAWNDEQRDALSEIADKAMKNGVTDLVPRSAEEIYRAEPHLGPGALAGLEIPGEGIICPFTPPLAFATEAVAHGVEVRLSSPVTHARREGEVHVLETPKGALRTRWVVNAAGLFSDDVDTWFVPRRFTVTPRRGELIVYDKLARSLLSHVILPVPTKTTKGVLVSPTVFGNVLLGPTAEDLQDRADTSTSEAGLASLLEKGARILPALLAEEVTATYAGLRAATEHGDYQIHVDGTTRYACVGGIRSTGLTGSLAIAEHVVASIAEAGLVLGEQKEWRPVRMPSLGERSPRPHADAALIAKDPAYARIVCHCERVSEGELRDAMRATVPARTLDGLRRRTRCLQGRCQGFFCLANVSGMLGDA